VFRLSEHLSNDFGFLLPDHDVDPERELQGECSGARSLPGQQQFLVRPHLSPVDSAESRGESNRTEGPERTVVSAGVGRKVEGWSGRGAGQRLAEGAWWEGPVVG